MTTKYYHITAMENLESILKEGLKPQIGPRAREIGEKEAAVYLFPTMSDLEDALMSPWGEEAWDEDLDHAIIEVTFPENARIGQNTDVEYEVSCLDHIPPENVKLFRIEPAADTSRINFPGM
ncbi:hypothetical protein [Sulfitobacter sp. R18_1]|uniref:hypothetical protein n=1 Tax=Sulfitobacter sp. R18_1 TaxID=2821104 RepID=UPI001ADAE6D0|nr:hypothetical protein [Sulfitobacter sp. R18_1]MBO9428360.1 hypothetical protein [Sulfitobacter sp. R18_1]